MCGHVCVLHQTCIPLLYRWTLHLLDCRASCEVSNWALYNLKPDTRTHTCTHKLHVLARPPSSAHSIHFSPQLPSTCKSIFVHVDISVALFTVQEDQKNMNSHFHWSLYLFIITAYLYALWPAPLPMYIVCMHLPLSLQPWEKEHTYIHTYTHTPSHLLSVLFSDAWKTTLTERGSCYHLLPVCLMVFARGCVKVYVCTSHAHMNRPNKFTVYWPIETSKLLDQMHCCSVR